MSSNSPSGTEPELAVSTPLTTDAGSHGWRTAIGTLQFMIAQVVALLLGFGVSIVLTRGLGPERYGLYTVAAATVIWVEQSVTSMFYQPAVKFLAEAELWKQVASALVQSQFAISLAAALLIAVLAAPLSVWLGSPQLAPYLRVLAISIPISGLAHAHQSALVGRGAFGRSTLPGFFYWPTRLLLAYVLLRMGLSVWAGIWALIGAAMVELLLFRLLVRPPLLQRSSFPMRTLLNYSTPLFLNSMALRLLTRVDLLLVQARAGATAAGWYGAAQNLSILPLGLLGAALCSPLLSTLSRLKGQQRQVAQTIVTQAIRFVVCLLPFASLAAGAAAQVVRLMYGPTYLPTSAILAWLMFGALALTMVAVCVSLLTAAGKPGWTLPLTAPLLPAAALAHWMFIPRYGAIAAAAITTVAATLGALACLAAVVRVWGIRLPLATAARSVLIAVAVGALAESRSIVGVALLVKLALLSIGSILAFLVLRELSPQELRQWLALARRETLTPPRARGTLQPSAQQRPPDTED